MSSPYHVGGQLVTNVDNLTVMSWPRNELTLWQVDH